MLAGIAEVARSIGRIPAVWDLVAWRVSGHSLPAWSTYRRHFGNTEGVLRSLRHWAAAADDRKDIAVLLNELNERDNAEPELPGAVYLLRLGQSYKIGCSRSVRQRVHEVRRSLPRKAKLLHLIATEDPHGIEAYWHRRFADKRQGGEWFRLSPQDVAAFRRMRFG